MQADKKCSYDPSSSNSLSERGKKEESREGERRREIQEEQVVGKEANLETRGPGSGPSSTVCAKHICLDVSVYKEA